MLFCSPLPHGLYDLKENAEVCLFVKDLNKKERDYEPTVRHFKELLERQNVKCISQVSHTRVMKSQTKVKLLKTGRSYVHQEDKSHASRVSQHKSNYSHLLW